MTGDNYFRIGTVMGVIAAALTFVGAYIYCVSTYGFLLGFGLGWLPSGLLAAIVFFVVQLLWLPAICAAVYLLMKYPFQGAILPPAPNALSAARSRETFASPSIKVAPEPTWVLAGKRREHESFVDVLSIRVDGDVRLASRKLVYPPRTKRGRSNDSDKWVNYIVTKVAVNCSDGRERDDFLSVYYEDGTVWQAYIAPPEWNSVTSGTDVTNAVSNDAVRFICAWKPN